MRARSSRARPTTPATSTPSHGSPGSRASRTTRAKPSARSRASTTCGIPPSRGRVGMMTDLNDFGSAGLLYVGADVTRSTEDEWHQAGAALQAQKDAGHRPALLRPALHRCARERRDLDLAGLVGRRLPGPGQRLPEPRVRGAAGGRHALDGQHDDPHARLQPAERDHVDGLLLPARGRRPGGGLGELHHARSRRQGDHRGPARRSERRPERRSSSRPPASTPATTGCSVARTSSRPGTGSSRRSPATDTLRSCALTRPHRPIYVTSGARVRQTGDGGRGGPTGGSSV